MEAQNGSKAPPGGQDGPSSPKVTSRAPLCSPKLGLSWATLAPSWPQDGPRWPKMAPRWAQDGPKLAPRRPNMAYKIGFPANLGQHRSTDALHVQFFTLFMMCSTYVGDMRTSKFIELYCVLQWFLASTLSALRTSYGVADPAGALLSVLKIGSI